MRHRKQDVNEAIAIDAIKPISSVEWCEFYGVDVTDNVAVLFKALNDEFVSPHGVDYSPGLTPVAADWDGGIKECGGGLHFSPHPLMARDFNWKAKKFAACPVNVNDIVVHPDGSYPEKVKAKGCCAPTWEVDKYGNRVDEKGVKK